MPTDELKNLYIEANRITDFFEEFTPCVLYRGQSASEAKRNQLRLQPNPGFKRSDGTVRDPDVKIIDRDGKLFVAGCRSTSKHDSFRGVSMFDKTNPNLKGFTWYALPAKTEIPKVFAVTKDDHFTDRPNHHTLAPKDEMPLELFLVWLKALDDKLSKV